MRTIEEITHEADLLRAANTVCEEELAVLATERAALRRKKEIDDEAVSARAVIRANDKRLRELKAESLAVLGFDPTAVPIPNETPPAAPAGEGCEAGEQG